jgi:hypothetical protein
LPCGDINLNKLTKPLKMMRERMSQQSAFIPERVLRSGSAGICAAGIFYLVAALHWA